MYTNITSWSRNQVLNFLTIKKDSASLFVMQHPTLESASRIILRVLTTSLRRWLRQLTTRICKTLQRRQCQIYPWNFLVACNWDIRPKKTGHSAMTLKTAAESSSHVGRTSSWKWKRWRLRSVIKVTGTRRPDAATFLCCKPNHAHPSDVHS